MANREQDVFFEWAGITVAQQTDRQLVLRRSNGEEELFNAVPGLSWEQAQAEGRDCVYRDGVVYEFAGFLVADDADDDEDDLDDEDFDDNDPDLDEDDVEEEARAFYEEHAR